MKVVFVTGMSGSGKTTVTQVFSELRYTIIESAPLNTIDVFLEKMQEEKCENVAVIISEDNLNSFSEHITLIEKSRFNYDITTVYIKADDDILIKRFQELRKTHPLQKINSSLSLSEAIDLEEDIHAEYIKMADYEINTSYTSVVDLRDIIKNILSENQDQIVVNISSFGFKYGRINDADFVFDLRFLPNPHYIDDLKHKTGLDKEVYDYVFSYKIANEFYDNLKEMMIVAIDNFKNVNKLNVSIAFACTGGQHRSVSFAQRLAKDLEGKYIVNTKHLESKRGNW